MVPVTVTQTAQHIHVLLPIPGLVQSIPVPNNNLSILQRLTTPSTTWEEPLWHEIRPHTHIDSLRSQLLNTTRITIVSDAAVHTNSHGTCAWVIWANSELWTGEGFVPGHPQDMYSGLAEAYGIYTALSFLHQYCTYFPLIHRPHHTVHVYCDNQGVLDRATRKSIVPYPRDAISDDYPIFAEISQILQNLQPLQIEFHHIKGHQDTKSDKPLTLPEKLNIDCDAQASKTGSYHNSTEICNNPLTPASHPHLQIKGKHIIRHLQHSLRDAAQSPAYFTYLQEKFDWPACPSQTIHWPIIQLTISRFRLSERHTIVKFIHEWLPLQDRYHVKSLSAEQLCPSCRGAAESAQHFLACPHTDRQQIWKDLHQALQKHAISHNLDHSLHDLLAHGLLQGRQSTENFPITQAIQNYPQFYMDQQRLGWKQLYYGRYTTQWIDSCAVHHPHINSTHYYAKCLTLTWKAVLDIWAIRNKHLHPSDPQQADQTQLQATVQQIFHDVQKDPNLQDILTYTTAEVIMTQPTRNIRQWVTNCHNHIRNQQKAAKIRAKLHNHDIRQYFIHHNGPQLRTSDKNLLHPP